MLLMCNKKKIKKVQLCIYISAKINVRKENTDKDTILKVSRAPPHTHTNTKSCKCFMIWMLKRT